MKTKVKSKAAGRPEDLNPKPATEKDRVGKVYAKQTLFLRLHVGEADKGRKSYNLSLEMKTNVPLVESNQTGKWFSLSWEDLIRLAIQAGIDE